MPKGSAPTVAYRLPPSSTTLFGTAADRLVNIDTNPLPDGSLMWVIDQASFYVLLKASVAAPSGTDIIQPSGRGNKPLPGRWFRLNFLLNIGPTPTPPAEEAVYASAAYADVNGTLITSGGAGVTRAFTGVIFADNGAPPVDFTLTANGGIWTYNGAAARVFKVSVDMSTATFFAAEAPMPVATILALTVGLNGVEQAGSSLIDLGGATASALDVSLPAHLTAHRVLSLAPGQSVQPMFAVTEDTPTRIVSAHITVESLT